ncbi:hypothetical protein Salmi_Mp030 (mitochondrion) [Salvia miltiorrhiza]|uniref:Uncharacterized protein n=1 Tax=Salvia miltiorrhiza TaxID=226208 RepID=V9P594_SALMI|nr:hypothetical protein Salmi_Mp030 [Salvia miltiorrhiza]AGU16563.1 hypothetical protein Salmi_Mp030 [Salvia miltiorrhiza]
MDFLKLARVMGIGGNHQLYNVLGGSNKLSVGFFIAELDLLSIMQKMHNLKIFQYGSNIPIIDVDNNQLIDTDLPTISDYNSPISSSDFIKVSISGSEVSSGSSTHSEPLHPSIPVEIETLHSTIVHKMEFFLEEREIQMPDHWSTYELLKEHVINNEALFYDISFLNDMIADLSVAQNPGWVEATIDMIHLINYVF